MSPKPKFEKQGKLHNNIRIGRQLRSEGQADVRRARDLFELAVVLARQGKKDIADSNSFISICKDAITQLENEKVLN